MVKKKTFSGDLKKVEKIKNLKINGSVNYKDIPIALKQNKILIMPYNRISFGRSKNINLSKYMSPLKLFDYLACERIIIASKLPVYSHILKHNSNSIVVNNLKVDSWKKKIENVLINYKRFNYIRHNSLKTAKKYTWKKRVKEIILFNAK